MICCAACQHFRRDPLNQVAGMGMCGHPYRLDAWYPEQPHKCEDFTDQENARGQSPQRPAR